MNKKITIEKFIVIITGTWLGERFELIFIALLVLSFLMIVDYISGMLASKKEAAEYPENKTYGWNSKKSIVGIYKKVGYILTITVALSADYMIYKFVDEIGVDFKTKTLFGILVVIWFIINELISILENAGRMGVILPQFLINVLAVLKNDLGKK